MNDFFQHQMDYIYFFYGLSFIIMAIACFTMSKAKYQLLPWKWLITFGLIHGLNEWLDMIAFLTGGSDTFTIVRTLVMILSFIALFEFGRSGLQKIHGKGPGAWLVILLTGVLVFSAWWFGEISMLNPMGRYLLGFPGSLLTAVVLIKAAKLQEKQAAKTHLFISGMIFGLYAVCTGLIVPKADFFLANLINDRAFFDTFGFPIQLIRGLCATTVAISMALWSAYTRETSVDDVGTEQVRVSYVRWMVFTLVAMVSIGWVGTNALEKYGENIALSNLLYRVSTAESVISHDKIVNVIDATDPTTVADYHVIKQQLADILKPNKDCTYLYLVGLQGNKPYILLDFIQASRPWKPLFTSAYLEVILADGIDKPGAFYHREEGVIHTIAPVMDNYSGEKFAFFGMDIDEHQLWIDEIAVFRLAGIVITMVFCAGGAFGLWILMMNKTSDLQIGHLKMEGARLAEEKRWKYITASIGEGILVLNQDGLIDYVNPEGERLLKWNEDELVGQSIDVIYIDKQKNHAIPNGTAHRNTDQQFACKDGSVFPVAAVYTSLVQDGQTVGSIIAFKDITERKKAEERILHLAYYDALTGLPNRSMFMEHLSRSLDEATAQQEKLAIFFLDLDQFKLINDTEGHNLGDEFLQVIARCLSNLLDDRCLLARLGGDEFAILVREFADMEEIHGLAEVIIAMFRRPIPVGQRWFRTSASIGITIFPEDGDNADILLRNADLAMYRTKELGRDSYEFYTRAMDSQIKARAEMENDLRNALQNNEFVLHYQPQVDSTTKEIVGFEALLRWQHPERGLVPPGLFIPFTEETGLIVPIGEWVLHTACSQNKEWQLKGYPPVKVAVNTSARQFEQKDFVEMVKKVLNDTGLEPRYLEIEITESSAMQDFHNTNTILKELKSLGVNISIDDFGTGYASLSYLTNLSLNTLKIDRSFIINLDCDSDKSSETLVKTIISLAKNLNLNTLAEGVETETQFNFLSQLGCDYIQGYLFYKPLPVHEMEKLLGNYQVAATQEP